MNKNSSSLLSDDIGKLLFIAALIFGALVRLQPASSVDFPILDGGLFYQMVEAIKANGMRLPLFVEFNGLQIPFAYPPLGFYLTAAIGKTLNVSTLALQIWLPAIFTILVLPAFYYLSIVLFRSPLIAGMATFMFAFLPRSLTWMIMGGGITRAPGQVLFVLAASQYYLLYKSGKAKYLFTSILLSSLVCLTHPEAAIHTAAIALLMWIAYGRNKEGIKNSVIVAIGTLIGAAPWWASVLSRYGLDPLLSAGQTGLHSPIIVSIQFLMSFAEEPLTTPITIFAVIGFFIQLARKEFFLPAWLIIHFIVEPRNAANVAIFPLALLAAIALTDLILPGLAKFSSLAHERVFQTKIEKFFLLYLAVVLIFNMLYAEWKQLTRVLSEEARAAMQWVDANTPSNARFLVITGETEGFTDYTNEWFPVLSQRRSQTTVQGYEWIAETDFTTLDDTISNTQECVSNAQPLPCIEKIVANNPEMGFDYIYIKRDAERVGNLVLDINSSGRYQIVFTNSSAIIFKKAP